MKHITLIIIAMLFSVSAFAQQIFETDFTQTKLLKISGKTTEKAGHIIFDGNDHLTMTYTQPEGKHFIIEGNMVKINMDGKKANLFRKPFLYLTMCKNLQKSLFPYLYKFVYILLSL